LTTLAQPFQCSEGFSAQEAVGRACLAGSVLRN
jgi:hypothetical protein